MLRGGPGRKVVIASFFLCRQRAQTRSISRSTKGWVRARSASSMPSAFKSLGNSSAARDPCRTSSSRSVGETRKSFHAVQALLMNARS
jgi:hypothetical protein